LARFKNSGKKHTLRVPGVKNGKPSGHTEVTGYVLGDMKNMYVAFSDGKTFSTKETRAIADGRNAASLFSVVK
jgi:hypothetical protein